ncbi:MAG: hypothetical protein GY803_26975 [Chloroflexi bacterium]|nr:hypothetical protein [Chloroflexota bacterium]
MNRPPLFSRIIVVALLALSACVSGAPPPETDTPAAQPATPSSDAPLPAEPTEPPPVPYAAQISTRVSVQGRADPCLFHHGLNIN